MKKCYSLVVSVVDTNGNRVDAHEISSCNNRKDISRERTQLRKDILNGKYDKLNCKGCILVADIEVHDYDTYELLEII